MSKFTKGHYLCPEAIGPSNFLLIIINLFIKLWGSSSNSIWDILLPREKCPNLQRAITYEIFFSIYSKLIRSSTHHYAINSRSFKALAPTVFEIQSTLLISNSKGLTETLWDIRTSTYQSWESEETINWTTTFSKWKCNLTPDFVCVEVLWPNQPNVVMSSTVSLLNHTFTGQA